MFPSFTSLAQREQKRQELLERAQRRVRQTNAKREMYEGASWASDISNGITTVPKKSTESTQTDISVGPDEETPEELKKSLADILKKSPSDKNSGINPEVSTDERGTDVNVRPVMVDAEVDARPSVVNIGMSAKPSVVNTGVSAKPSLVEVAVGEDKIDDGTDDELNDQNKSKEAVAKIFEIYQILADLRIHPISHNGRQLTKYYIGEGAKTYSIKSGKLVRVPSIDWAETYSHIGEILTNDVRFLDYMNETKRRSEMEQEDKATLYQVWHMLSKRKRVNASEGDVADRTKQRLDDSFLFDNLTSTTSDQIDSKIKLFWLIHKNRDILESNGLRKKIAPVLSGTAKSLPVDNDGYVWIDGNSVSVYGLKTNRSKPAITKKVNWVLTLQKFVNSVKERGLKLEFVGEKDKEIEVKDFTPANGEAQHGVMSGADEDMNQNLSNADNDAKAILTDYYALSHAKDIKIPFRLKPVVEVDEVVKTHNTYYFGVPTDTKPLNIKNDQHKQVSGAAWKGLMKNIRWMDTFLALLDGLEDIDRYLTEIEYPLPTSNAEVIKLMEDQKLDKARRYNLDENFKILNEAILKSAHDIRRQSIEPYEHDDGLQKLHDESETAYQAYGEAQKRYEEAKNAMKGNSSKSARSALKAATSAMKATKAVFQSKAKNYSDARMGGTTPTLKGHGLRGAGVAPLEGVVRRGRTYNLNEIQGLATPSAYTYRQLGSKYIRIPDLDAKTLVIVQPNRRKCGPKCQISDSLQAMIRTLVYKNHIDQASYDKLSIDDKKMFKEILAITHLQYNFHDKLTDPLETLRAEYDKLKGEMELGNDNPSIIKQLKSLTVDMYSNRLIGDNEFKEIITRLL